MVFLNDFRYFFVLIKSGLIRLNMDDINSLEGFDINITIESGIKFYCICMII